MSKKHIPEGRTEVEVWFTNGKSKTYICEYATYDTPYNGGGPLNLHLYGGGWVQFKVRNIAGFMVKRHNRSQYYAGRSN